MASSKIDVSIGTRSVIIVILCVGCLFNIVSFVHFYFSSSKKIDTALESLTLSSVKLYEDSLARVDDYLSSLVTNRSFTSSSFSSDGLRSLDLPKKEDTPILPVVDSIEYDYYVSDGRHIARIGRQDFSDGSPFPRGGVISRVYDDCILLEGGYRVARGNARVGGSSSRSAVSAVSSSSSSASNPSYDGLKEIKDKLKL